MRNLACDRSRSDIATPRIFLATQDPAHADMGGLRIGFELAIYTALPDTFFRKVIQLLDNGLAHEVIREEVSGVFVVVYSS